MKNVKPVPKESANFYYLNHTLQNIYSPLGVEILTSPLAFQKYSWSRQYFKGKPKAGYFIWVKKQPQQPLTTCAIISQEKITQQLQNLLIIEKGITVESSVFCGALASGLCAKHYSQGKIILKEGASLFYKHLHNWGKDDYVNPDYEFILEKEAKLNYIYQVSNTPENLTFKTKLIIGEKASAKILAIMKSKNSTINIVEEMQLIGRKSKGIIDLRVVADKNTKIKAVNNLIAKTESEGHLECQGIILDKQSHIELIPALINQSKEALLTHEAAIGRIKEEEINYLRARGLTQKEAINLIVNGFLKI